MLTHLSYLKNTVTQRKNNFKSRIFQNLVWSQQFGLIIAISFQLQFYPKL